MLHNLFYQKHSLKLSVNSLLELVADEPEKFLRRQFYLFTLKKITTMVLHLQYKKQYYLHNLMLVCDVHQQIADWLLRDLFINRIDFPKRNLGRPSQESLGFNNKFLEMLCFHMIVINRVSNATFLC